MRQGDLIKWYIEQQNAAGVFSSLEEVVEEYKCLRAIIEVFLNFLHRSWLSSCNLLSRIIIVPRNLHQKFNGSGPCILNQFPSNMVSKFCNLAVSLLPRTALSVHCGSSFCTCRFMPIDPYETTSIHLLLSR